MRKPITGVEALVTLLKGGCVWHSHFREDRLFYRAGGVARSQEPRGLGWTDVDLSMVPDWGNCWVEVPDAAPSTNDSKLAILAGANGPSEPQWMTSGQALDWMIRNDGKVLVDDLHYIWRRCGNLIGYTTFGDAVSNMKVTQKSFADMIGRRFMDPSVMQQTSAGDE